MFIESFSQYLANEFNEILFLSISNTKVYVISCHTNAVASEDFLEKVRAIPYVESVDKIQFDKIVKGHKLFAFNPDYFEKQNHSEEILEAPEVKSVLPDDLDLDDQPDDI